jgi:hypothetical protein
MIIMNWIGSVYPIRTLGIRYSEANFPQDEDFGRSPKAKEMYLLETLAQLDARQHFDGQDLSE